MPFLIARRNYHRKVTQVFTKIWLKCMHFCTHFVARSQPYFRQIIHLCKKRLTLLFDFVTNLNCVPFKDKVSVRMSRFFFCVLNLFLDLLVWLQCIFLCFHIFMIYNVYGRSSFLCSTILPAPHSVMSVPLTPVLCTFTLHTDQTCFEH